MITKGKYNIKRIVVRLLVTIVLLLYYPVVMSFVNAEYSKVQCVDVKVRVMNNSNDMLISNKTLEKIVYREFPTVKGTLLDSLHLMDKEAVMEAKQEIERCEMYTTPGGVLHVDVWQREPIMRVFRPNGSSYYMDSNLQRITAKFDEMRTHVVIVNGAVNEMQDTKCLVDMCKYIREDKFWKASIEQIYVNDDFEFILVPRVGAHVIEFGTSERMEEKFRLLHKLYTEELDKLEWNLYKKVSVKFQGQIVCTKK